MRTSLPLNAEGDIQPALLSGGQREHLFPHRFRGLRPFLTRICKAPIPEVFVLLTVAVVLSRSIGRSELYFYGDEARHAMDGVFVRDLLVDRPLRHPLQYTYEYYAKYPAIAPLHWPPLFPFVEGVIFLIFGVAPWASHLAVWGFALIGAYFWYRIAVRQGSRTRALLAAFIFPLLPKVLLYESVTMLEIPQVALCLGTLYFWLRWLESENRRDLWKVSAFAVGALLTSQGSVFLAILIPLHFLLERRFHLLRRWDVWVALGVSVTAVLSWYLLSFHTLTLSYQRGIGQQSLRHAVARWSLLYYLRILPLQLGGGLLILAVVGVAWAAFKALRQHRFMLLWLFSTYACFTLIQEKDPRHTMIWLPPLVYFALLGLEALVPGRRAAVSASIVLAVYVFVGALRFDPPKLRGIEDVTRYVLALSDSDIVYYQGRLDGDFIFFVRMFDPEKRHMVAREKQIVATNIVYSRRQILHSTSDVLNFFKTWGIRYAVVENRDPEPGLDIVRTALNSDQFEALRSFPVQTNDRSNAETSVAVYRYRGEIQRSAGLVDIPMMTIHHDLHVKLDRLAGSPWPR